MASNFPRLRSEPHSISAFKFECIGFWPAEAELEVPLHTPEGVAKPYLQAERNYRIAGNEEAAGAMYRRTLERALADKYPTVQGKLAHRIDKLVKDHVLTGELGDWAHQIRLIGNEAVHDEGDVDPADLTAMRGFVEAVLRYLYTLPGEVARLRSATA